MPAPEFRSEIRGVLETVARCQLASRFSRSHPEAHLHRTQRAQPDSRRLAKLIPHQPVQRALAQAQCFGERPPVISQLPHHGTDLPDGTIVRGAEPPEPLRKPKPRTHPPRLLRRAARCGRRNAGGIRMRLSQHGQLGFLGKEGGCEIRYDLRKSAWVCCDARTDPRDEVVFDGELPHEVVAPVAVAPAAGEGVATGVHCGPLTQVIHGVIVAGKIVGSNLVFLQIKDVAVGGPSVRNGVNATRHGLDQIGSGIWDIGVGEEIVGAWVLVKAAVVHGLEASRERIIAVVHCLHEMLKSNHCSGHVNPCTLTPFISYDLRISAWVCCDARTDPRETVNACYLGLNLSTKNFFYTPRHTNFQWCYF